MRFIRTCFSGPLARALSTGLVLVSAIAPTTSLQAAPVYPSQPIRIVVPYSPGTGYDSIARIVSPILSQRLGQTVMVDNRPGASGIIGSDSVVRAEPDGYSLLMIGEGTMSSSHLYKTMPFDPLKDLAPVTQAGTGTLMLAASPGSGIKSVADLIARAKADPDKLTYASSGVGTSQHLKMELFKDAAGIRILHVPYKGTAGATADLIGNQVTVGLIPVHVAKSLVAAGKLVPLAVVSAQRNPVVPEVPTLTESGVTGVEANMWYAVVAPKKTPDAIVARLNTEIRSILDLPEVKGQLRSIGIEVQSGSPAELMTVMQLESSTSAQVIRKHNISID